VLYGLLVTFHLLCAVVFIGVVFFEVLFLEKIRAYLPAQYMGLLEEGIHRRGRQLMPWFVAGLFLTGTTMALVFHRTALSAPFSSSFGTLLSLKILLAVSVLVHFILAMKYAVCGNMTSRRFRYTHLSVFFHMLLIVLLAKGMYYIQW